MGTTYQKADDDVLELLGRAMTEYHPGLAAEGVAVGVLMAANPDGVPVKHGGYPALAKVSVVSLKDRVTKEIDAEIVVDELEFNKLRTAQRVAMFDHELTHLELKRDKDSGEVQRDDLGRPRLKTRPGDFNGGDAFREVIERHGDMAIEFYNAMSFWSKAEAAKNRRPSLTDGVEPDAPGRNGAADGYTVTIEAGGESVTVSGEEFSKLPERIAGAAKKGRTRGADTHHGKRVG
jgi:hypothetical protein